jgi:hypothetical protein
MLTTSILPLPASRTLDPRLQAFSCMIQWTQYSLLKDFPEHITNRIEQALASVAVTAPPPASTPA